MSIDREILHDIDGMIDVIGNQVDSAGRKMVVFDIETYGLYNPEDKYHEYKLEDSVAKNLKDPVKIQEAKLKKSEEFALSPKTGKIILFGWYDGMFYHSIDGDEKELLVEAWRVLWNFYQNGCILISKGGKRFDLPYMFERSVINNIQGFGDDFLRKMLYKYDNTNHCDLENVFTDGGLYTWGYLCGLTDQFKNNGSEIKAMYEAGDIKQIADKNAEDLRLTYQLYKRVKSWI